MTYTEKQLEMEFYTHSVQQMASTRKAERKGGEGDLVTLAIPVPEMTGRLKQAPGPGECERGPRGPGPVLEPP